MECNGAHATPISFYTTPATGIISSLPHPLPLIPTAFHPSTAIIILTLAMSLAALPVSDATAPARSMRLLVASAALGARRHWGPPSLAGNPSAQLRPRR